MNQSKTFSEFLTEQNLVSPEDLVSLLIAQSKAMPTAAEIMHSKKLLSPAQLLTIFALQTKTGQDFVSTCKSSGFWSAEVAAEFASEMNSARVPIVQLLQSSGKVTTEKLVLALDSYLSQNAKYEAAPEVPNVASPVKPLAEAREENSHVDHLHEFYTAALQEKIIALAKTWDQSEFEVTTALLTHVHGLVGAARFAKQPALEEIFANAESNIRALSDCATALPSASIQSFRAELVQAFENAWTMRDQSSNTQAGPTEAAV